MALIYLAVMVAKWWYFSPSNPQDNNCVACVVAVIWILTMLIFAVLSLFWIFWSKKYEKGITFVIFLSLICLLLAVVDYFAAHYVVGKLFYGGVLRWEESQASYLIDTFIPHSIGLLVISSLLYSVIRVLTCHDLVEKPLVFTYGVIIVLSVIPLFYIGLKLY
ncbi:MAG: hypothetical protein L0Z73_14820 [Gammaproteobacteria bacterium]|nr:hypothetical protein [Gammaproteobacteria bacterium]